jgi:excinuclease ABC subunit A
MARGRRALPACAGQRLNPEALAVRWRGKSIADYGAQPSTSSARCSNAWSSRARAEIARDLVAELRSRLGFLREVGLSYLALDRSAPTLSGGEAQRIRLAAQLGSNLRGVCYILDEPTIGLHPRDNQILLDVAREARGEGQHAGRRRARRRHDPPRAPRDRPRPGAGRLGGA